MLAHSPGVSVLGEKAWAADSVLINAEDQRGAAQTPGSTNFPPLRSERAFPRDNARHGDRMNKCGGDAPKQALGLVEYS